MHLVDKNLLKSVQAPASEATSSTSFGPDNLAEMTFEGVHLFFSDRCFLPVILGVFADAGLGDKADQRAGQVADEHRGERAGENDCPGVFHSQSTDDGDCEPAHRRRSANQLRYGLHRGHALPTSFCEPGETREGSSAGQTDDLNQRRKIHAAVESDSAPTNCTDSISTPESTSL